MASGVNKVILVGNLGKDIEVRYTQSGKAVATLRLAMTERRKDGDGWKDHTEWMDVVVWDKTAENCGQYLSKGSQVYVEGRIQTREYDDKDGNKRWKTEVVAHEVRFLGSKRDGEGASRASSGSTNGARPAPGKDTATDEPQGGGGFIDDDLPF